jgi:hypothetical protein
MKVFHPFMSMHCILVLHFFNIDWSSCLSDLHFWLWLWCLFDHNIDGFKTLSPSLSCRMSHIHPMVSS